MKRQDANEAYDEFLELFRILYDLCFPVKLITIKCKKSTKWISRGIQICSKKQRYWLWKYRLKPTSGNKAAFKSYSYRLKRIIKLTQKSQNNHLILNSSNKSKAAWQLINNNKSTPEPIQQIQISGNIIKHPKEIAKAFNDFFIDQISSKSTSTHTSLHKIKPVTQSSNSLFMSPVVPQDIIRIIKSLRHTNSTGYDEIRTNVIQSVCSVIATPLCHIINLCLSTGTFPKGLKTTIIKPLHKKDCKEQLQNYRPIALIPVFSKVIEKVIYEKLNSYLTKFNILCDEQMGFRKNRNINMAIYNLTNHIITNVDRKTPVCALLTDMTKAFDYVDHKTLIEKLNAYGVRGNALELLRSYLIDRNQCTEITRVNIDTKRETKYLSNCRKLYYGVPQGSVLGPPLFLIYINDLPQQIDYPMVLFADDSTAIIKCTNNLTYEEDVNNTLKVIIDWLDRNNLIINIQKTKILHFYQRLKPNNLNVSYNGQRVEEVKTARFLGILVDSQLTWKMQADDICARLSKSAYALFILAKKVNLQTVLIAYHGMVSSVLRFGIIFWGNCAERETIFKTQKRCIRSMVGLKSTDSCEPVFKSLKVMTFPCLYIFEVALFVKCNLNLFPAVVDTRQRTTQLRSQYKTMLCTRKYKTALARKSILGMGPVIYNKIDSIKTENLHVFKRKWKNFLIEKCYYSITDYLNDTQL